jgi:hypothetical protein
MAVSCEVISIVKRSGGFTVIIKTTSPELHAELQMIVEVAHVKEAAEEARKKLASFAAGLAEALKEPDSLA